MSTKVKGFIADLVRAGTIAAAALIVFVNAAPSLSVPASWVAYASVAIGIINGLVGVLSPYAATAVKSLRK